MGYNNWLIGLNRLPISVSVIICTAGRPEPLRETLLSLGALLVPATYLVEVLVVDNRPDSARDVARVPLANCIPVRYLEEPLRGKSNALNTAIQNTSSEILAFTDDDLRFPVDWLQKLIAPIVDGNADAVAGTSRIAPHLERPWMEYIHRVFYAEVLNLPKHNLDMTGNNMAFHRRVLSKVPGFDPAIGPGAMGTGEETLFSEQIRAAGFRIVFNTDATVEHHFDESRLLRENLLHHAIVSGRSRGYTAYHYDPVPVAAVKFIRWHLRVFQAKLRCRSVRQTVEGCTSAEIYRAIGTGFINQFKKEVGSPRKRVSSGPVAAQCDNK